MIILDNISKSFNATHKDKIKDMEGGLEGLFLKIWELNTMSCLIKNT